MTTVFRWKIWEQQDYAQIHRSFQSANMGKTRETISSDDSDMDDGMSRLVFTVLFSEMLLGYMEKSTLNTTIRRWKGSVSGSLKAYVHTNLLLIQTSYRAPDMFKISNSTHSSAFDYEELAHDDKELWLIRLPHNVSTLFYFLCLVWRRWNIMICGRDQVLVMLFTTSSFTLGKKLRSNEQVIL